MAKKNWTQNQKIAIESIEKNLLVSASAGSGKTSVMIERIVSLLQKGVTLSEMAVCTFTKAAAADMKDKLYTALSEPALKGEEFAKNELRNLPQAQISTLHSFCQQLIKTYFYAIEIDPNFEIIDENDSKAILYECIENEIQKQINNKSAQFCVIYDIYLKNRGTAKLSDEIARLYNFASVQPDFFEWLKNCTESSERHAEHLGQLKEYYLNERMYYFNIAQSILKRTIEYNFTRNIEAAQELTEAIFALEKPQLSPKGKLPLEVALFDLNEEYKDIKGKYNEFLDSYNEAMESADPAKTLPYAKLFAEMALSVKNMFDAKKRKKALVDYSDLEHFTLQILNCDSVKENIVQKYKYIFVDEYQDINPLQESILKALCADKFFVGDVKQSIYGFRMCDPTIFVNKYKEYNESGEGKTIELNANFRSADGILMFCNNVFSDIMTASLGRVDYKNTARFETGGDAEIGKSVKICIAAGKAEESAYEENVYSVKNHSGADNEIKLIDAETNLVTNEILNIIANKEVDSGNINYKDIVVLLRACSGQYARTLKDKLTKAGIPNVISDKKKADENTEINVLIQFLKLIDNRRDDIALACVMRSAFFNFSDGEMAKIRSEFNGKKTFYHEAVQNYALNRSDGLKQKLADFFEALDKYTFKASSMKASELAGMICADFDYFKYVFALKGGETKAKELAAFLDIIDTSSYNNSVFEFVKSLNFNMPELITEAEADAVKIMTVHASKGLEFPFVILGNISRKFDFRDLYEKMLLDSVNGLSLKYWDLQEKQIKDTSLSLVIKNSLYTKTVEEEMRILYVALTRAKNELYIFGSAEELPKAKPAEKCKSYLEWLLPQIESMGQIIPLSECAMEFSQLKHNIMYRKSDEKLVEKIKEYTGFNYKHTGGVVKVTVTKLLEERQNDESGDGTFIIYEDGQGGFEISGSGNFSDGDKSAAVKGTAYHKLMEVMDFGGDAEKEWEKVKSKYPGECALTEKETVFKAFNTLKGFTEDKKVYKEIPFIFDAEGAALTAFSKNIGAGKNVLVQGVIDLLVKTGDSYCIIDYKTGSITNEKLSKYSRQLQLYKQAAEKILKTKIDKIYIYSFEKDKLILL